MAIRSKIQNKVAGKAGNERPRRKAALAGGERAGKADASAPSPRRSKRSDGRETRARVLLAAAEVFARDGFEGASLRGIAERANIDIATLKYHVQDKAALFAEVYQDGYEHFQQALGPHLLRVPLSRDAAELEGEIEKLLERVYDYLDTNQVFIRLWLFRLLEGPREILEAEETMRSNVIAIIEAAVHVLYERGLVRQVDVRMLVLLIVTALPTLVLGMRARPGWLGESEVQSRQRFIAFFTDLLRGHLLPAS
jgi:AcrR family transcriptional regulator